MSQTAEHSELQPNDPQSNGPKLFYGLRYHAHIVKPGEFETYHDQMGYWLWEPATGNLSQTVAIPRGQVVMAFGCAMKDATSFELLHASRPTTNGICSNPFLEYAFQTVEYRINVTINPDGTWSYDEDTTLIVHGQSEPFHHTDRSVRTRSVSQLQTRSSKDDGGECERWPHDITVQRMSLCHS